MSVTSQIADTFAKPACKNAVYFGCYNFDRLNLGGNDLMLVIMQSWYDGHLVRNIKPDKIADFFVPENILIPDIQN